MGVMKNLMIDISNNVINKVEMDKEYIFEIKDFQNIDDIDDIITDYENDLRLCEYIENALIETIDQATSEDITTIYNMIIEDIEIIVKEMVEEKMLSY